MIGLTALIIIGLWCGLGWHVWHWFIGSWVQPSLLKWSLVPVFWVVWLVGPIADEIVGYRIFQRECARLPEKKFFGPVHIGAGAYFDEEGRPRWKDAREFERIRMETRDWRGLFEWRDVTTQIVAVPITIERTDTTIFHAPSHSASRSASSLHSRGGWVRRTVGAGILGQWNCESPGAWPRDEDVIRF